MEHSRFLQNLNPPTGKVDVILDTDAFNEVDDQFAIAYLLASEDRAEVKGITAAPFSHKSLNVDPKTGMEQSYEEILHILELCKKADYRDRVYKGAERYLPDEKTPVENPASRFMAELSKEYSPEKPLYIIAIGAITNVASALLMNPDMKENTVVVWLGGHAFWKNNTKEYNMMQDVAGARVVFGCGVPLVQIPCGGVADRFDTTKQELEYYLKGKNPLCDYLCRITVDREDKYMPGLPWSKVIWDVTAVAWLLNEGKNFVKGQAVHAPIPTYDHYYAHDPRRHLMMQVVEVRRALLFRDLFTKLAENY